jgi:hypothetical protein
MPVKPLDDYKRFPKMAHWFDPVLLIKLLNNVATSSMFGQYADRRLMVAALDTVPDADHVARAMALSQHFKPDDSGSVWFDFVADLGDGFDSTYAVATLLAKKELKIGDLTLPRGQALIMGGDEVYPAATKQAYRNQLWQPYKWAFPDHDPKDERGVPLLAIPGNHDWYDGLVLFLAYFCREKQTHFGSWRTHQRRSYFAIQITENWWLWAVDIQLAEDIDQPQDDYFRSIADAMPDNAHIILCSAEPGWLYTDTNDKSWEVMGFAIGIAKEAGKNFKIPILISGDTHHYSRYASPDGKQFITSGGGGAFLHPTHQLEPEVEIKWSGKTKLALGQIPAATKDAKPEFACYPSQNISRRLTWWNLIFAFTNWDFSLLMGAIYGLAGILIGLRDQWDAYAILTLFFGAPILWYTTDQEKSRRPAVLISCALHTLAHVVAVVLSAQMFTAWNAVNQILPGQWYSGWIWLLTFLLQMGVVGAVIGSTIFGWNMLITCLALRMNRNDAFSSFRLGSYNNFLRVRISGDTAEVFAIGLEDVPRRKDWKDNPKHKPPGHPDEPVFIPERPLKPHLIERVTVTPAKTTL